MRLVAAAAVGALLGVLGTAPPAAAEAGAAFARAWTAPGQSLEARAEETRTAALELGLRNVEPAARMLLAETPPEGRLAAARAAARLAPDLPAAHIGLALALVGELDLPGVIGATGDAMRALGRHLESSLWLRASAAWALAVTLVWGSLLYLLVVSAGMLRHAAHDLGDRVSLRMPAFSRVALLAAVVLAPAVAGEAWLGLALGCLAVLVLYGARAQVRGAVVASALLVVGLHPVMREAGRSLAAFGADPVAVSAHAAEYGIASPLDLSRLERVADVDPLAARALAMGVKRTGDFAEADARYATLLEDSPQDPYLLNNAANVRLALGDPDGAIALYRRALELRDDATIWFNLSQAWGVALNVVELDAALARAQALDGDLVQDLSEIQERAIHFVADVPVPNGVLRARLLAASDGSAVAGDLRRRVAPGWTGTSEVATGIALAAALAVGVVLRGRFRPSRDCTRCHALVCPRCDKGTASRTVCEACHRLLYQPEGTDRALRIARADALKRREARMDRLSLLASMLVPGAAAALSGRQARALVSCLAAAAVVASIQAARGVMPDPLAAGGAGPAVFLAGAVGAALLYLVLLSMELAARRSD